MTGEEWAYPTANIFTGTFDGGGHTINGLTLTGTHGLFEKVESDVLITDLTLSCVTVNTKTPSGALFAEDVSETTTITVKNVTVDVVLSDSAVSGGLFGNVKGNVVLDGVTVHAYQPSHDTQKGGAIFATFTGTLTANEVTVYSSLWHTLAETKPAIPEGITFIAPTPLKSGNTLIEFNILSVDKNEYSLQVGNETADTSKVYYASKIEDGGNVFILNDENIFSMGGQFIEIFAINDNKLSYYSMPVSEKGYVTEDNFQKLPYVTDGEIILTENIDFTNVKGWVDSATSKALRGVAFRGIFDGCNYVISNFKGRIFGEFYGVAKNVTLKNAAPADEPNQGIFCDVLRTKAKLENVTITAKLGYYNNQGVLARILCNNVLLNKVNICALPAKTGDAGFLGGFGIKGASVECTECLFVVPDNGGGFPPVGIRDGSYINNLAEQGENYAKVLIGDYNFFGKLEEFLAATQGNALSQAQKERYEKDWKAFLTPVVKEIKTTADLSALFSGEYFYYYLTQDLDCAGLDLSSAIQNSEKIFEGIVEGNGHCINALPQAIFHQFRGRVQNLAFTNMQAGASVCRVAKGGAFRNIFLHSAEPLQGEQGLLAYEYDGYDLDTKCMELTDVFVMTTGTREDSKNQGFLAGYSTANKIVTCQNSVFISKYQPIATRTETNSSGKPLYVSNLEGSDATKLYDGFLKGEYQRYQTAQGFENGYKGTLTELNAKYYELFKDLSEQEPEGDEPSGGNTPDDDKSEIEEDKPIIGDDPDVGVDTNIGGDGLVKDREWNKYTIRIKKGVKQYEE